MTNNEIIKALKWLILNFPETKNPKDDSDRLCNCINLYCQNALDLINRQKAEIDKLCIEIDDLIIAKDLLFDEAEALTKKAKAEAIKEFVEQIHVAFRMYDKKSLFNKGTFLRVVDEIKEEMVGEV